MMRESARAIARRLFGGDRIGAWSITDARNSSGLRVVFTPDSGGRAPTFVVRPPGGPAFFTTKRAAIALLGVPEGAAERALLHEVAARLRKHETDFEPGVLEELLAHAVASLAPIAAEKLETRSLRPTEAEIRLNLACNQRCFFCNCDGFAPNVVPARAAAVAAAEQLVRDGATTITITGGEPTLNAALDEVARAARTAGATRVMVQTNAVAFATPGRAHELREAGVDTLFVSLHSLDGDVSDRITGVAGTHALTVQGIDAALAAGFTVITNFVINRLNQDQPPEYVRGLRERWPQITGRVFSFMAPVAAALRNMDYLPRISDALPPLRAALDDCIAKGEMVRVAGVCGLPLCTMRGYEAVCDESTNPIGVPLNADRVKPPGCAECMHAARCSGVWQRYVERYGDGEFVAVRDDAIS
jgi:pyruvate-formate lyase-activating enzyme